jgi:hypothetical protein
MSVHPRMRGNAWHRRGGSSLGSVHPRMRGKCFIFATTWNAWPCSWADKEHLYRFRVASNRSSFFQGAGLIPTEAENALSAATAPGQWAPPDCFRLDVAAALFSPLFLLGRSRNLRLLLYWLLGFTVAPNLTFRHRNSPLRGLADCKHRITRSAVVSVQSRPIRSNSWG